MKLYIKEFYKKIRFIAVMVKQKYFIVIDTKTGKKAECLKNYSYLTYKNACDAAQFLEKYNHETIH